MKINGSNLFNTASFNSEKTSGNKGALGNSVNYRNGIKTKENTVDSRIEERRKFGRNLAKQVVKRTYDGENKVDQTIDQMKGKQGELDEEIKGYLKGIKDSDKRQKELIEMYGIDKDSKEFQDLLKLNRARVYKKYNQLDNLSEEEQQQVNQINEEGLTEFQKASLEIQEERGTFLEGLHAAVEGKREIAKTIIGIKLERLKSAPMVEAESIAEDIFKETEESITSMLIQESKDKVDEEVKENEELIKEKQEEKAEEAKEELEKEEEKMLYLNKDKKAEGELKQKKEQTELSVDTNEIQSNVEALTKDLNLLMEDLKGLLVNIEL